MRIILDTANLKDIEYYNNYYPIEGVTTNPTILAREGGDVLELLKNIRAIIGEDKELHVQVTETEYEKMIEEAKAIVDFLGNKKNTFIKIPATDVGLKVTRALASEGYGVTVTAVLTATQALLAANSGASYVAPYVSRLENILADGVATVADIAKIFSFSKTDCQILAASFKTAKELIDIAIVGCHAATVGSTVMAKLLAHPTTDTSIEGFKEDWNKTFGNTTILSLLKK